tara:strand:- start:73 stop:384 length:312 start_codon:yes stop_codon:yes gene_type:complete
MKHISRIVLIFSPAFLIGSGFLKFHPNQFLAEAFPQSEERDVFETLDQENNKDSFLPTSPMELMQTLQKNSSMEDATSPTDALDDALKLFNDQDLMNNSSINN